MSLLRRRAPVLLPSLKDASANEGSNGFIHSGVESREEVLRQVRGLGQEIIVLDCDPCPTENHDLRSHSLFFDSDHQSGQQVQFGQFGSHILQSQSTNSVPILSKRARDVAADEHNRLAKQQKLSHSNAAFNHAGGTDKQELTMHSPSTNSSPVHDSTTQNHAPTFKKALWQSGSARENMLKSSDSVCHKSLSNDPSANTDTSQQKSENGPAHFFSSSWSFDGLDELNPTNKSDSTLCMSPPSMGSSDGGAESSPVHCISSAILASVQPRDDEVASDDIAESQRLRDRRRLQKSRSTLSNNNADFEQGNRCHTQATSENPQVENSSSVSTQKISSSDRNEEDQAEIESYLDILEDYLRSQKDQPVIDNHSHRTTSLRTNHSSSPSPFSRQAAEKWRTQSRHIDISAGTGRTRSPASPRDNESSSVQAKDIRLERVRAQAFQKGPSQKEREAERRLRITKFHAPDLENESKKKRPTLKPKPPLKSQAEIQSDIQDLMGTKGSTTPLHGSNGHDTDEESNQPGNDVTNTGTEILPKPSLSALNQLGSGPKQAGVEPRVVDTSLEDIFENLPASTDVQGLALPKYFHQFSDAEQRLYKERGATQELEKDLELISETFALAARLGVLEPFDPRDAKVSQQLTFLRKFAEAVLNERKSGKPVRSRAKAIRDKFKRRLDTIGREPDEKAVDVFLPKILQPLLFDKLRSRSREVRDRLSHIVPQCIQINASYHNKRARRNGRRKVGISSKPATTKQRLAKLRSSLVQFKNASHVVQDEVETIDLGRLRNDTDDDSEISEEDEGESFMRPLDFQIEDQAAVPPQENSGGEDDQLDKGQPETQVQAACRSQVSQGINQRLLESMLAKRQRHDHLQSQGVQRSDSQMVQDTRRDTITQQVSAVRESMVSPESIEVADADDEMNENVDQEASQEFDDSEMDLDDEGGRDDEDEAYEPQCKRYIVKCIFRGLSAEYEEDEYLGGNFLSKEDGKKKVLAFTEWVREQIPELHPELDPQNFTQSTSNKDGLFEQQTTFGDNEEVACRAWLEEELHNPSDEAYQKAKVFRACRGPVIWIVDWKRTIEPREQAEEGDELDNDDVNDSDDAITITEEKQTQEGANGPKRTSPESSTDGSDDLDQLQVPVQTVVDQGQSLNDSRLESPVSTHTEDLVSEPQTDTADGTLHDTEMIISDELKASIGIDDATFTDDLDDLFGPDDVEPIYLPTNTSSPPASESCPSLDPPSTGSVDSAFIPITTRPTPDQLRLFSMRSLANRHAKEVFMHWYIERLVGPENVDFIARVDEDIEEELRGMGDRSCWSRSEECPGMREGVEIIDRLEVTVRRKKCCGPSN